MKKMIAIVLALMLCVTALSVTAFAAWDNVSAMDIVGEGVEGINWAPAEDLGNMTKVSAGIWEKTLEVPAGATVKFKAAGNNAWDDTCNFGSATIVLGEAADLYCGGDSGNMEFTADKAMTVKFTVNLTGETATILVSEVVAGGETGGETVNPGTGDMNMAAVTVALLAATAGLVVMGKKKEF